MATIPFSLGAVTFTGQEVPESLPIGALSQMLAVHTLVGGTRITQSFGVEPEPVSWTGRIFDQNVSLRVQQLRLYAAAGQEILLSWGTERYYCKIRRFTPTYFGGYCDYAIDVVITRDANGAFTVSSALSIDQQVQALQQQASTQNAFILANIPPATINAGGTTAGLTVPAASPQSYQPALATLNATLASAGPIASNITAVGPGVVSAATAAAAAVATFIGATPTTSVVYTPAQLLQSSLSAIALNVARGQAPAQAVTQGVSLFKVAAQQYGDITRAFDLAKANGSPSPFLTAVNATTVALPPFPKF